MRIGVLLSAVLFFFCCWSASAHAAQRIEISIQGLSFAPAAVTIHVGDTVVWKNNDDRDHTVTAANGSFRSGNIPSGQSYEHTFTAAGSFPYTCSYHPRMRGTITVQ